MAKSRTADGRNCDSPWNHPNPATKSPEPLNIHGGPYTKAEQRVPPRKKTS